jgi:hypothetical protein
MSETPDGPSLEDAVQTLVGSAFEDPKEGRTLWAFHAREVNHSLTVPEVIERIEDGRGVFIIELVWDEDLELIERGEGKVVKAADELFALLKNRVSHMSDLARDPSMAANAPEADAGTGQPKAQTATPWHPANLGDKLDD